MRIIRTKTYRLTCEAMGLQSSDIKAVSRAITESHDQWPIMAGMEGAQKARIGLDNKGKRDGGRVVYYAAVGDRIFFLLAYPKSEQKDLTETQRIAIRAFIRKIKEQR